MKSLKNALPSLPAKTNGKKEKELARLMAERELRLLEAERARRSLAAFVTYTMPKYCHNSFSLAVCAELDQFLLDVVAGKRPILVLQAPPQHGKSQLISRHLPAYIFGKYPHFRVAACSYAKPLASKMNRDVQRIMLGKKYATLFPESSLNTKRVVTVDNQPLRNSDGFELVGHDGSYLCTGVNGPLTGNPVDIGIIDDPIKNQKEALSPVIKDGIRSWYETVFETRMSENSGRIIMATAWAVDDLAATIIKTEPRARHLKFPAINDAGQALAPNLHSLEKLQETKAILAPAQWAALYQQSPVLEGGNIFEEPWIRRWDNSNLPAFFDEIIHSWDLAFKDTTTSDFVVGQVWGRAGVSYYLLHQVRGRMNFVASCQAVLTLKAQYPQTCAILVEDKANGPALMSTLEEKVSGLVPVEPYGSKVARAHAVTSLWFAGNVFIPEDKYAPWVPDFVDELISFPAGGHDDQVDSMTQGLTYLNKHGLSVWEKLANG